MKAWFAALMLVGCTSERDRRYVEHLALMERYNAAALPDRGDAIILTCDCLDAAAELEPTRAMRKFLQHCDPSPEVRYYTRWLPQIPLSRVDQRTIDFRVGEACAASRRETCGARLSDRQRLPVAAALWQACARAGVSPEP
jgi:hypothetical protein